MRGLFVAVGWLVASVSAMAQPGLQERLKAIQADPVALRAAVEAGRKASFFCANCHGENGISKTADVPNLAGQNPAYLLEQIRKFGSGERKDAFMQGLINVLKDEDRLQITLFYAAAPVTATSADPGLAARGKAIYAKLCQRCHGEQARGTELYPRLAGQKTPYLQSSITRYRDGTGIRNNQLMSIATATLKSDEITAVAHFLTQLP
jgi:cytochrome c553